MSTQNTPPRRRRSDIEDDSEADIVRSSQRSTPSTSHSAKRARTHDSDSDTPSEDSEPEEPSRYTSARHTDGDSNTQNTGYADGDDGNSSEGNGFQPGAIVRVKLTNFVTYAETTFWPGPNLNMIIGPNGTGKSSLVCAICLGLGWGPQHLGRAAQIGEFVKHNTDVAQIEIELQRRPNEPQNHAVRLKIIRDGNAREWFLNGKRTSLKAVQSLTRSLSIQIDNLCQFLPQDKVSEFAALTPVELLIQTQRAAAPEQMLEWHEELKKKRKDQKSVEELLITDQEQLGTLETRQDNLQAEVQRLQERNRIQEQVDLLKKSIPFVDYRDACIEHRRLKREKKEAQRRLIRLNRQVEPTLQSINHKEDYTAQIDRVIREKKRILQRQETAAAKCLEEVEQLSMNIQENEQKVRLEGEAMAKGKNDVKRIERNISDLKTRLSQEEPDFNGAEYNEKIRLNEAESRKLLSEVSEIRGRYNSLGERARAIGEEINTAKIQLKEFDSHEGQQQHKLEVFSKETAKAWKWIQEHQNEFEKEVYGPALISCTIKDSRYTAAVESVLGYLDLVAITTQTPGDFKKLSDHIHGTMRLHEVTLRSQTQSLAEVNIPSLTSEQLKRFGFDGWALDFLDGPAPVLAMLCSRKRICAAAVSLRDVSEEQHHMIVGSDCSTWVAGRYCSRVMKRAEYGAGATSTITNIVKEPRFWTNAPVDTSARREIEGLITNLQERLSELKTEAVPLKEAMREKEQRSSEILNEVKDIKKEKAEKQKAHGEWAALPAKIRNLEASLEKKADESKLIRERVKVLFTQHDLAVHRKVGKVLEHKEQIDHMRQSHQGLLDATIRYIEGASDVEALKQRNQHIVERLDAEKELVAEAERDAGAAHARAMSALQIVTELSNEARDAGNFAYFENISPETTVEHLEREIAAEESKLDYMHANNPNAIRDFERRQLDIDGLKAKISEAEERLEKLARGITRIRGKWEPELDKLVAEISEAFSYNFEQIGCAGEVGIHKDDDFSQWSIEIKVKFRENESLQILDQHRQSGGERSVSTIFYLMSLQSLARAPFRVVDEINQGMDPRNERMVHERMVEIACKEHTSQYFLITPKLLTGLRYDRRMKVHCIASGEHMPKDHTKLDVQKILAIRRSIVAAG